MTTCALLLFMRPFACDVFAFTLQFSSICGVFANLLYLLLQVALARSLSLPRVAVVSQFLLLFCGSFSPRWVFGHLRYVHNNDAPASAAGGAGKPPVLPKNGRTQLLLAAAHKAQTAALPGPATAQPSQGDHRTHQRLPQVISLMASGRFRHLNPQELLAFGEIQKPLFSQNCHFHQWKELRSISADCLQGVST